jgi:NAD(P)-dependent dehydrogenase (short-subunit alcohol dehydrogenase family)
MKTIVINGGTKGVGRELVHSCMNKGYNVVFSGRDENAANLILSNLDKHKCIFVKVDNSDINSLKNLFDIAFNKFNRIDGYVHYSGITPIASIMDCAELVYDEVFQINLKSAFFCTQYACHYMQKCGGGSIIYFGSSHMDYGQEDRAPYAISKGALNILSNHIAHHYAKYKIRSNYLVMGWTNTEGELKLRKDQGINESELLNIASKIIPMGRMLNVNDPIPTLMHLLSDDSCMVTGSIIRVTGGEFI